LQKSSKKGSENHGGQCSHHHQHRRLHVDYLAVFVRDEKIVKITLAGVFVVMKRS